MVCVQTPNVHFPALENQSENLDEIWTIHNKSQRQRIRSNAFVENFAWQRTMSCTEILVNLLDSAWFPQSGWLPIVCLVCYSGEGERGWDTPWRQVGSDTTNRLIQLSSVNSISLWRKVLDLQIVCRILWLSVRECSSKKYLEKSSIILLHQKSGISNQTLFYDCDWEGGFPRLQLDMNCRWWFWDLTRTLFSSL